MGVCHKLGEKLGIDPIFFQIAFVLWFFSNPMAIVWYLVISLIV